MISNKVIVSVFLLIIFSFSLNSNDTSHQYTLNPLQPLAKLGRKLVIGINKVLSGKSPDRKFGNFSFEFSTIPNIRFEFRTEPLNKIKKLNGIRVMPLLLEFQYYFYTQKKLTHYFRSLVDLDIKNPRFCYFDTVESANSVDFKTSTLQTLKETAPFCYKTAQRIITCIKLEYFKHWKIAPTSRLTRLTSSKRIKDVTAYYQKISRKNKQTLFNDLSNLKFDEVRIWFDEIFFLVFDKNNKAIGVISGRLKIRSRWRGESGRNFFILSLRGFKTKGFNN